MRHLLKRLLRSVLKSTVQLTAYASLLTAFAPQARAGKPLSHDKQMDELRQKMDQARMEMQSLNRNKDCDGDFECEILEYGWRNCGGPSDYLIISTRNANQKQIKAKITEFTRLEKEISSKEPNGDCTPLPKQPQVQCASQCKAKVDGANPK